MRYLKLILFRVVAGIQNAFDFKHNKKIAILNTTLLCLIFFGIVFSIDKHHENNQKIEDSYKKQTQIAGMSSIAKSGRKEYLENAKIASDPNVDKAERSSAQYKQGLIEGADTTSFQEVSPGEYQLDKLKCLCNEQESDEQKNKTLDEYCMFSAGETIWLFKHWIQNIVGLQDPSQMKTGFDVTESILYINKSNLNEDQQEYLTRMLYLLWNHSELSVRSHKLQIFFV